MYNPILVSCRRIYIIWQSILKQHNYSLNYFSYEALTISSSGGLIICLFSLLVELLPLQQFVLGSSGVK